MKKTILKRSALREIKDTKGRYLAILSIIALGVGFFTGVRITTPAMVSMMNSFLKEKQLYDIRLVSTVGWDEDSIQAMQEIRNVRFIEGSMCADAVFTGADGTEKVLKAYSMPENINRLVVREGRLPVKADECIIDSKLGKGFKLGDFITLSPENSEDTSDLFFEDKLEVVGIADSSLYINFERGTATVGNGSADGFVYLPKTGFDADYFTDIYVKLDSDADIYSEEYDHITDVQKSVWEAVGNDLSGQRHDKIIRDATKELNDGKDELYTERMDAEGELRDAKNELDKAKKELAGSKTELDDAAKEIASGQKELDDAKIQLDDSKKQLDDAKIQLDDSKKQLEDSGKELDEAAEKIASGQTELENGWAELEKNEAEFAVKEQEFSAQEAAFNEQYSQALAMIDMLPEEQKAPLLAGKKQLDDARTAIDEGRSKLSAAREELEKRQAEFDAGKREYESGKAEYDAGKARYESGLAEYEAGLSEYENGKAEYEASLEEFENGKAEYESGLAEYNDGLAEYEDGLAEYEEGLAEYNDKIADAEKKIRDAERDIRDIKDAECFVLTRDANIGYACFESDSEIVEQVARVFPIFFILVAALVCMTTMSRMVEEQRSQIGMLKALGYSGFSIMGKLMFYSGSAALLGCVIGYAVGTWLFPAVIWMTYKLMYIPLDIPYMFDLRLAATAAAVSVLCSVGTTWISCRYELRETAAALMRPKAPKAGKRVLLERIPFIWNKMKFLSKVSVRNIFRYKGRLFMMIIGVGGCTALLLTGLGLRDSVAGFADVQYGEIQTADAAAVFKGEDTDNVKALLEDNSAEFTLINDSYWDLIYDESKQKSISLVAVQDFGNISHFMNFRTLNGESMTMPGTGEAIVSHSVAERYGAEVGEEITLRDSSMNEIKVKVTGVFENHVYNYVFVSASTLRSQLGSEPEMNGAYINFDGDQGVSAVSKSKYITNLTRFSELRTRMGNMMSSLDYVVLLVILSAAGLAFIVIYNLTNINITERIREIATIKVLGFFRRETSAYVLRENIALTSMGIAVGLVLGVLLHRFVMAQIVVDLVDFSVRVLPMSFVLSVVLTFVFNFIVNLFMEIKLEKINMAESLKSVE